MIKMRIHRARLQDARRGSEATLFWERGAELGGRLDLGACLLEGDALLERGTLRQLLPLTHQRKHLPMRRIRNNHASVMLERHN